MTQDDDPLYAWRKPDAKKPADTAGKDAYQAIDGPHDRPHLCVHFCPRLEAAWEWLPYVGIERIVHDGPHGTRIGLIWGFAVIVIEGRNLQTLDRHFAHHAVAEVHAFDPVRFHAPTDESAAFVDSIMIHTEGRQKMLEAETQLVAAIGRRH